VLGKWPELNGGNWMHSLKGNVGSWMQRWRELFP